MPDIAAFIEALIRPLQGTLIPAAIVAGLFVGFVYVRNVLVLHKYFAFHLFFSGASFLFTVFLFRVAANEPGTNPPGWVGIALLWFIFCLAVHVGQLLPDKDDVEGWINRHGEK